MAALTYPLSCRLGSTGLPVPSNSAAPQEHSVLPPSCFSWLPTLARATTVPKPGAGDSLLFFRPPTSGYCWSVSVLPPTPAARGLPPAAALAQGLMVCLDRNFSRTAPGSVIQCTSPLTSSLPTVTLAGLCASPLMAHRRSLGTAQLPQLNTEGIPWLDALFEINSSLHLEYLRLVYAAQPLLMPSPLLGMPFLPSQPRKQASF